MKPRENTPAEIAEQLGVRYCGIWDMGKDVAFLFNDDNVTESSFAVMQSECTLEKVKESLETMRKGFEICK